MNRSRNTLATLGAALALSLAFGATAQTSSSSTGMMNPPGSRMGTMHSQRMGSMQGRLVKGRHTMPATVSSVDTTTGIVKVQSEGHELVLHFPPSALAGLKAGDQITVHLGYSKP